MPRNRAYILRKKRKDRRKKAIWQQMCAAAILLYHAPRTRLELTSDIYLKWRKWAATHYKLEMGKYPSKKWRFHNKLISIEPDLLARIKQRARGID